MESKKKYAFVLAHADLWSAQTANKLMKAVADQGVTPILIVSRATRNEHGGHITKITDFQFLRGMKEDLFGEYLDRIDALDSTKYGQPDLLSFKALAAKYSDGEPPHFTTTGGTKGGEEVTVIADTLAAKEIVPEVMLSGDTMALLPQRLLEKHDCFSLHPGPLPAVKGMQGTGRQIIHGHTFHADGSTYRQWDHGQEHLKGTMFYMAPELDEGPPVDTALTPYCCGMNLLSARSDMYMALADKMIEYLPRFLDKSARKEIITAAVHEAEKNKNGIQKDVGRLTQEDVSAWTSQWGPAPVNGRDDAVEIIQNQVMDADSFKTALSQFFPKPRKENGIQSGKATFDATFNNIYRSDLCVLKGMQFARLLQNAADALDGYTAMGAEIIWNGRPLAEFLHRGSGALAKG